MSDAGVNSVNITSAPKLDEIIGNASGSTRRQKVEQFAAQLASTRPLSLLGLQAPLFALVDDLEASSTTATSAWVYADGAASGIYSKVAGVWTWALPLPYSFIEASNTGAGTANAIVATTTIPVTDGPLVILPIVATTTGSATVSFNGSAPVTIKTVTGNDLPANALVGGMRVMGIRSATDFRLVTDIVSGSIIAQAQAAAAAAIAAKEAAEDAVAAVDTSNFYNKSQIDTQQSTQNAAITARALASLTITAGGGLMGGGDLTANRTLALAVSSQGEAEAGTENTKAMTPLRVKQAISALASGGGINIVTFTSSGSYVPSPKLKWAEITVIGGGGGWGNYNSSNVGGAGGGTAVKKVKAADLAASNAVVIGAGGALNTNGGNSSITLPGGTLTGGGGGSGYSAGYISTGGSGSGGDRNYKGSGGTTTTVGASSFDLNVTDLAAANWGYGHGGSSANAAKSGVVIIEEHF